MDLKDLSPTESLTLCWHVEKACIRRLQRIMRHVNPAEKGLVGLLQELVSEEEEHLRAVGQLRSATHCPLVWHMGERELMGLMRSSFPSLSSHGIGKSVSRQEALEVAEALEKDSSRFYRELSECSPSEESRTFFRALAVGEEKHGARLHEQAL